MAVVGSPDYFKHKCVPATPQDLLNHHCLNMRMPTSGGLYAWELEREGQPMNVRVGGPFACNDLRFNLDLAKDGHGLAFVMEDDALPLIAEGKLVRVLEEWCEPFTGYHLYYPSRRQHAPAFSILLDALRYKA